MSISGQDNWLTATPSQGEAPENAQKSWSPNLTKADPIACFGLRFVVSNRLTAAVDPQLAANMFQNVSNHDCSSDFSEIQGNQPLLLQAAENWLH